MAQNKPFKRTCRQFTGGSYTEGGRWRYVLHQEFAKDPEHYVRAFTIIQKDLIDLFDYIEPADTNLACYSYRIHALFMRTCIEVEANCKAILSENGYSKPGDLNMEDYKKLDSTHRLSSYRVRFPVWRGGKHTLEPYVSWASKAALPWYKAYHAAKHDRHDEFRQANFGNLLDAVSGLVAILSAQFNTWDFSPSPPGLALDGISDIPGFDSAIGAYFQVHFPDDWPDADRYNFDWDTLKATASPFQSLTF